MASLDDLAAFVAPIGDFELGGADDFAAAPVGFDFEAVPFGGGDGEAEHALKRELSATNLVSLGIGAIIGTGIFVLTGTAAAQYAGPAIVYAF